MSLTSFKNRRKLFLSFNVVEVERMDGLTWGRRWLCLERFVPNKVFWHVRLWPL
jgi:hypothetical protein